jgi:hypothetical protein
LFVRRNHIVVPAKEQHVDYYQIVKEQPKVRTFEPEVAWCQPEGRSSDFRINIQSVEHRRNFRRP